MKEKETDFIVHFHNELGDLIREHASLWVGELHAETVFIGMSVSLEHHAADLKTVLEKETTNHDR